MEKSFLNAMYLLYFYPEQMFHSTAAQLSVGVSKETANLHVVVSGLKHLEHVISWICLHCQLYTKSSLSLFPSPSLLFLLMFISIREESLAVIADNRHVLCVFTEIQVCTCV